MRLAIKIIAAKELSAFSVSAISIFSASKSPKPKSNNNFHFSHLLSGWVTTIHRKHRTFKNDICLRYLESFDLFRSAFMYGSIYPSGNLYHKKIFFVKLGLGLKKWLKKGQNVQNSSFWVINFNLIVCLFWHLLKYVNLCFQQIFGRIDYFWKPHIGF